MLINAGVETVFLGQLSWTDGCLLLHEVGSPLQNKMENLREYRCPECNKLLAKGILINDGDFIQIKCRGCGGLQIFLGVNIPQEIKSFHNNPDKSKHTI